jgi:LssY C-terminus
MNRNDSKEPSTTETRPRANRLRHRLYVTGGILLVYLLIAYVALPLLWRTATREDPGLDGGPHVTHTASGIPGDPVNIALVGSESDVIHAMIKAGWFPADPITFDSSVRIAVDSVIRRPDDEAPVSPSTCSAAKRIWLSSNRSATARARGITCGSGAGTSCSTRDRSGSAPQRSMSGSG